MAAKLMVVPPPPLLLLLLLWSGRGEGGSPLRAAVLSHPPDGAAVRTKRAFPCWVFTRRSGPEGVGRRIWPRC